VVVGQFLLIILSAFPKVLSEMVESFFAEIVEHETRKFLKVFEMSLEVMDFLFDIEKVLKSLFDGRIGNSEFEKEVSFLEVGGSIVEFEVMDGEDVVGNEIVDKSEHFDRMRN